MNPIGLAENVAAELRKRAVDEDLVRAIEGVGAHIQVMVTDESSAPLSLSTARDAHAAVYVRKHSLLIVLDPPSAERLHRRYGWTLDGKNKSTSFVQVNSDDLKRPGIADLVSNTLLAAFRRAEDGPRGQAVAAAPAAPRPARSTTQRTPQPRSTATAPQRGDMCPTHFMERSVNGSCPMCDE